MVSEAHGSDSHLTRNAFSSPPSEPRPFTTRPPATHAPEDAPKGEEEMGTPVQTPDDDLSHSEAIPGNAGAAGSQNGVSQNAAEENNHCVSCEAERPVEIRVSSPTSSTRAEEGSALGSQATSPCSNVVGIRGERVRRLINIPAPVGQRLLQGVGTIFPGPSQTHAGYPYPGELGIDYPYAGELGIDYPYPGELVIDYPYPGELVID